MLLSAKHQEEKCYSVFFPGPCTYKGQCHSVATPRALMFTVLVNQIYLFATRVWGTAGPCLWQSNWRQDNRKMTVLASFSCIGAEGLNQLSTESFPATWHG